MNSFATGVKLRCFTVVIPTGALVSGTLTGRTHSEFRIGPNASSDRGSTLKNLPVSRREQVTWIDIEETTAGGTGISIPKKNDSTRRPTAVSAIGNIHSRPASSPGLTRRRLEN